MSELNVHPKTQAKQKGLGRGLGSLLGSSEDGAFAKSPGNESVSVALSQLTATSLPSQKPAAEPVTPPPPVVVAVPPPVAEVPVQNRIWNLAIEKLIPNPKQPRQTFEPQPLQELAESIRQKGIIQPLLARRISDDQFEIIAGERRWRAAQLAGLKDVPVVLKDTSEQEVLELALIENIQRENLNPVEEAEAYEFLINKYNLTQQQLAERVGKERTTVANLLRLLRLQKSVRAMVVDNRLSLGQAKVLLAVADPQRQEELAQRASKLSLSVRALEKLVQDLSRPASADATDEERLHTRLVQNLSEELQRLIGSRVTIDYQNGRGRLAIQFHSDAELNQLSDRLRAAWLTS